jgi:peptide deformylase
MILPVVQYGDPVLRKKGAPIPTITPDVETLIADMFETMYAAHGVGLAAQQVGRALQLTVIDIRGVKDRPSQLWIKGEPVEPDAFMPLVLINPQLKPSTEQERGAEGCLSFPEIFGEVLRPAEVDVTAMDRRGKTIQFRAGGLLARAVLHETDHLHGILFIDRMDQPTLAGVKESIDALQAETKEKLAKRD